GQPVLLRNTSSDSNHWITIKLAGKRSNRDGFGARVKVEANGKTQVRDCTNAGSFASASDSRVYFGIGEVREASVTINWPSGVKQTIEHLGADAAYEIEEGASVAKKIPLKR